MKARDGVRLESHHFRVIEGRSFEPAGRDRGEAS
jgi:hypothetical protein